MPVLLLLGYLVLGVAVLAFAMKASPRLQQFWGRMRIRKTMSMQAWSNDVEETLMQMTSLDMQSGELEVHWAWLMENAPEHYDDKMILAWERLHRVQPALLLHAERLGRYKPELALKTMAACLDTSPIYNANVCNHGKGQAVLIPPPPALPSIPPPPPAVSGPITIPSLEDATSEPPPVATGRRPFMVVVGGRARPATLKSGT